MYSERQALTQQCLPGTLFGQKPVFAFYADQSKPCWPGNKTMQETPQESREVRGTNLDQPQQAESRPDSLGDKLKVLVGAFPSSGLTLIQIRDLLGQDALLVLTAFLTLVFMVPVSIPGVSTVFGGAILLIGTCRLLGRSLWLPKSIAHRALPSDKLRMAFNQGSKWLHRLECMSRPHRLKWLASPGLMDTVNNGALIMGAVLLMAPFGLIPFSNTLPALALLFLAIGLLQRDGLCILFGHLANLATIIYFAALVVGGSVAVREALRRLAGTGL